MRLNYVLPLAQMALAALLLRLWFLGDLAQRFLDSRGLPPAAVLLLCLDFPIGVPLKLELWGYLPQLSFDALFVAATGALWYCVALGVHSYRQGRSLTFEWKPLRVMADLLLVGMGACLGWLLLDSDSVLSRNYLGWRYFLAAWTSLIWWSLGSILFSCLDLTRCIRGKRRLER